mmetsp:Transcript_5096/g.11961  ORF Transcript_5096/g.11961 Transcript_5096/m.11961 type:complete len:204 (+) Transcript_5096:2-613(+)
MDGVDECPSVVGVDRVGWLVHMVYPCRYSEGGGGGGTCACSSIFGPVLCLYLPGPHMPPVPCVSLFSSRHPSILSVMCLFFLSSAAISSDQHMHAHRTAPCVRASTNESATVMAGTDIEGRHMCVWACVCVMLGGGWALPGGWRRAGCKECRGVCWGVRLCVRVHACVCVCVWVSLMLFIPLLRDDGELMDCMAWIAWMALMA